MTQASARTDQHHPSVIEAAELQAWLATPDAPRLIDVRTPTEFTASHIPGSYNVPLDLLKEHRDELSRHLDEDVVLVCRSGARAKQAESLFGEVTATLPNIHVLSGGVTGWENINAPLSGGGARWELERQVRLVAGSLVLGSVLTSIAVPRFKWVAGAIGAGLTLAALTDTCAMGMLLGKLPYNQRNAPTLEHVVSQLKG